MTPLRALTLAVLAIAFAAAARAAVVPFTGSIVLELGAPPLFVPGTGLATLNGSGAIGSSVTKLSLPAGAFATAVSIPFPNQFPLVQVVLSAVNGPAVFSAGATPCGTPHSLVTCSGTATLHGRSGLGGTALIGLFGTATSPFANLVFPLGPVGAGSTSFIRAPLGLTFRLRGAGWTTGMVTVTDLSPVLTSMRTGGQSLNAGGGEIVLVSPISFSTNAGGSVGGLEFATWRISFDLPEPGSFLLFGTAVAAFSVRGLSRTRRRCT